LKQTASIENHVTPDRSPLTRLAERIVRSGLATPAVLFLEMSKPLAFFGSQALHFFGPVVTSFMRSDAAYNRIAELLEERENVEFLLQEIERIDRENSLKQPSATGKEKA